MLQGVRPSVERLRKADGKVRVAVQPHWVGGPQLLIAIDSDLGRAAYDMVAADLRTWLQTQAKQDAIDLGWRVRLRGSLPGGEEPGSDVNVDGSVELGDFTTPRSRGDERLGSSRDLFRADTLDQAFELVRGRQADQGDGVVEFALRLMALWRLSWLDDANLWAMSIVGHEFTNRGVFDPPASARIANRLEGRLLSRLDQSGLMTAEPLGGHLADWVDALQRSYDRYSQYAAEAPALFKSWGDEDASGPAPIADADGWWGPAARDPRRVIYRLIVNDAYDLQPIIGLPVVARALACHVISRVLVKHLPAIHDDLRRIAREFAA